MSEPNLIKAAKGTQTYNKKTGEIVVRDSGKRVIKPTISPDSQPQPPKSISTKRQKAIWSNLTQAMPDGVFTALDSHLIAAYVLLADQIETIAEELKNQPVMVEGSQGQMVLNPLNRAMNETASKIATLGAQLGLSPIARNNITAKPASKKPDNDATFVRPKSN